MKKILISLSLVCIMILGSIVFIVPKNSAVSAPDDDVKQVSAGNTALERLFNAGIIDGYDDGGLHPDDYLTRAQFAKLLNSAFEGEESKDVNPDFSDVPTTHWAYDNIKKAVNRGLLVGFPDSTFRPEDNITYEQAITVVCRVLDIGNGSNYPESYISAAIDHSITDGVNALIGEAITRHQAAIIIENALNYTEGQIDGNVLGYGSNKYASGGSAFRGDAMMMEASSAEDSYVEDSGYWQGGFDVEYMPPMYNTEEYAAEAENVFKNPTTSPLSTFSIDTDTASYSNLRRFILNGQTIPKGAIRSEELINYFDYAKASTDGENPFGVKYTVASCPWNSENLLAMITVSGEELAQPKPSNIVFLIDTSGSMYSYNKLPLVKQSLSLLLDKLGEEDTISIVTYASSTGVALEPTPASEKEKIMSVIDSLSAGGSTAGASGINLAYEQASKAKIDGNNRVILCTDGDFNVGISSEAELESLISEKRDSGIYLSVLGFGMGNYKDNKMETLAKHGNGNYAYIDNLREAKKVLVDEMPKTIYTIAKDVKIQVEFNPETVGAYRLIGYENRLLNNEDFANDAKDAGELGAGASVTVLYEIIPSDGKAQSELKYQSSVTSGSGELMTVAIRHKLPEADTSILNEYAITAGGGDEVGEDFYFACAVAELGMIVNDSEYAGTATYDSVIELARQGIGDDPYGIRCEFVQLVDLMKHR